MPPTAAATLPPVAFVGAGPGSADLLTLAALRAIEAADVVLHDRLIGEDVLALIPATATRVEVGKEGFGKSVPQAAINDLILGFARTGARVVRLKGGDAGVFGRLDEETETLARAGIGWTVIPGITAAAAAAAAIGQSLTRRGRNASLRILTGHDAEGFAEQDWRALARPGEVAAIYMGKRASRFIQGRLMMHGASPDTAVTIVENVSRRDERVIAASLGTLPAALDGVDGPAVILYGLAPARAAAALGELKEALA